MRSLLIALACVVMLGDTALAAKPPRDALSPTWTSQSVQTLDPALKASIDYLVGKPVADGRRVGMVVGIVDGSNRWVVAYGKKALGEEAAPTGDTLYEIGSVTKTFTSTALILMAADGRVRLSDSVSKYLPKGARVPSYKGKTITLENLATHTSGLPRMPGNWKDAADPYAAYGPADSYKFLATYKLTRAPGQKYDYSNFGAGLLGLALSRPAGLSYEKMISKMICGPLGMKDTVITLSKDQRARLAPAYLLVVKNKKTSLKPTGNWTFQDSFAGAGAIRSSVNDLLTYTAANIGLENSPLQKALDKTHGPRHSAELGTSIGLGWHITTLPKPTEGTIIWHNGGTGGYNSFVGFNKQRNVGVVVLSNGTLADGTDQEETSAGMGILALMMHPEVLKQ